jgi:hypothetical protein
VRPGTVAFVESDKEREHALLPVAPERAQVNRLADHRRFVNLVVARVDDRPHRGVIASEKQSINE